MGYAEDQLAIKQKALQDYLDQEKSGLNPRIAKTKDYLAGQDALRVGNTQDILGGTASKYGIDPSIVAAGADVAAQQDPAVQRARDTQLSQIRMKNIGDSMTHQLNQKMDEYQAAGYSYQQAQQFARQWQTDQIAQKNAAEASATQRDFTQQKADVAAQYQTQVADLNNYYPDPYEAAMYRALAGGITTIVGYRLINGKKTPVNSQGQPVYSPNNSSSVPPQELNLNYNAA